MTTVKRTITPLVYGEPITLGCDPELFFVSKKGSVVGSEKVLKKDKIYYYSNGVKRGYISIDGVQAEINPNPSTCRVSLAMNIGDALAQVTKELSKTNNIDVSFNPHFEVSEKEMKSLDKKNRVLGCKASRNHYLKTKDKISPIKVDPETYKYRSAGGHIHLGILSFPEGFDRKLEDIIPVMDILVGNTCVMIDRDPSIAERRKVYGRAGEYRIKSYGIEYRTLSNFWLKKYAFFSLVTGLARLSAQIVLQSKSKRHKHQAPDYYKLLMDLVDMEDIVTAINKNDATLARKNWNKIKDFIYSIIEDYSFGRYPLCRKYDEEFDYFINKGLDYWINLDPLNHWNCFLTGATGVGPPKEIYGWENFLSEVVRGDIKKSRTKDGGEAQSG